MQKEPIEVLNFRFPWNKQFYGNQPAIFSLLFRLEWSEDRILKESNACSIKTEKMVQKVFGVILEKMRYLGDLAMNFPVSVCCAE